MRTGLLIIAILFFTGCKNKKTVPDTILPQNKMQAVVWDMMRADQFLTDYVLNKDTALKKQTESIKLYQQILAINKVSKEEFERSFNYYKAHPLLLKVIMDSIANAVPEALADTSKHTLQKDSLKKTADSIPAKDTVRILKKPRPLPRPK
jgi:hypothetical protein